tara:strand:- start:418 stop:660 length:243 start_codon:yes stop_codon:yes gene_type:complete
MRTSFCLPDGLVQNEIKSTEVFILKQYIMEITGREYDEKPGAQSMYPLGAGDRPNLIYHSIRALWTPFPRLFTPVLTRKT